MQFSLTQLNLACATAGLLTLAACGGGGSGSGGNPGSSLTISGTAATGAAFTDASVTVKDSHGTTVGTASVGADGSYSIALSGGATAPFVINASRTNADGITETLVSLLPTASGASATVNITPVSTLIAARLSASGDPTKLADEVSAGTATITSTTVDAKVTEVKTILAPILTATGTSSFDPLGGTFSANGSGFDRLLDSIKVTITPTSSTSTNIEVGLKVKQTDGAAPLVTQFASTTPSPAAVPSVTATDLLPSGTSAKIAAHLTQLTNCYALAPNVRVVGGAIDATTCKEVFYGNDPANFKSNGKTVSAIGAFASMFNSGVQNVVFSQGNYEFTRANDGVIIVSYKSKTASGAETYDTFALKEDSDGKLKQYGNHYDYDGGVVAYHQIRRFPTYNQSNFNYFSTGYDIRIKKIGLDHVVVTTPNGRTLILKPTSGDDNLMLLKGWGGTADAPTGGTLTNTTFIRLRSEYVNQSNINNPAATSDGNRLFFVGTPNTNEEIAQIPAQSVWKFEYYTTGSPNTAVATQYYKTRARAMTIPELRMQTWAAVSSADLASVVADSVTDNTDAIGSYPINDERTTVTIPYTVPNGALPPTSLKIWGKYSGSSGAWNVAPSFADSNPVASTARSGNIVCASAGGGDTHCAGAGGGFVNPTRMTAFHLWARDVGGREFASFYAMYAL